MSYKPNWNRIERERFTAAQRRYDESVDDSEHDAELESDYLRDLARRICLARQTGNYAAYLTSEERQELADRRFDI